MTANPQSGRRRKARASRGKLHLRRCPACGEAMAISPVVIDSVEGCRFWSDGKMDSAALPSLRTHGVCPSCRQAFAFRGLERLDRKAAGAAPVPAALLPDSDDWMSLAFRAKDDPAAEKFIRVAWWQHLNDAWRTGHLRPRPSIDVAWRNYLDDNLSHLIDLLDPAVTDERFLLAEALRELGQFERALGLLVHVPPRKRWFASLLSAHAASGNDSLFGLSKEGDRWQPIASPMSWDTRA